MELIHLYEEIEMAALRRLYEESFPPSEKKPFSLMVEKNREGSMEILAVRQDGVFCGLAMMILHGDLALLDYLAIEPHFRGGGIGTEVLRLLRRRYEARRLFLEIEDPDEEGAENREERVRRKGFYLRNGLHEMPFRVMLFGVPMLIMVMGEDEVTFPEYHAIFRAVFSEKAARNVWQIKEKGTD